MMRSKTGNILTTCNSRAPEPSIHNKVMANHVPAVGAYFSDYHCTYTGPGTRYTHTYKSVRKNTGV